MAQASMPAAESKVKRMQSELRARSRKRRKRLSMFERELASQIITEKVVRSHWFQRAEYVGCYLPEPDEVDTWAIIARAWKMKKRVFAPVVEKNRQLRFHEISADTSLYRSDYGLLEPSGGDLVTARMLDVVVAPLVAFDASRHRIGMGGGYFDRTFAFLKHREHLFRPKLIGVAFACQKVEKITANPWDIRLFRVITDAR